MAYEGGITFLNPPGGKVTWNDEMELKLTGDAKKSWLYAPGTPSFKVEAKDFNVGVDTDKTETDLIYDIPEEIEKSKTRAKKCVIIGSIGGQTDPGARHYVLIVASSPNGTFYERVGAGYLPGRFITGVDKSVEKVYIQ
jgi:hypothetical protein